MLFSSEHEQFRQSISDFIDNEINPHVDGWEKDGLFPAHDIFKKMGQLGWLGITKSEQFGGVGLDYSYGLVLAEELGRIKNAGVAMGIGMQADMATSVLARFGSDELRQEFLAPAIAGLQVACIGISESNASSDDTNIKTYAEKDGDDYLINGTKAWVATATQADWVCLLANTSDGPKDNNKSLIIVPLKTKGVSLSDKFDKLGMRSLDTAKIFFDDVRVPQRNLIGEEGAGLTYQRLQSQEEQLWGAASTLKRMDTVIADTIEYTSQRMAFGEPLLNKQVMYFRIAELQTEVESLRSLVYRTCDLHVKGEDISKLASMAKLKSSRLLWEVVYSCLQFFGGMGYIEETPVCREYRDTRLVSIGNSVDEIMLTNIAKYMGTLPKQ